MEDREAACGVLLEAGANPDAKDEVSFACCKIFPDCKLIKGGLNSLG